MTEKVTAHPSNFQPHTEHVAEPDELNWKPSAIAVAETVLAGTEKPVIHHPSHVSNEDFTTLWNRVVIMDKAVMELIAEYRQMKQELLEAKIALAEKMGRIDSLEADLKAAHLRIDEHDKQVGDHDDRINWLET